MLNLVLAHGIFYGGCSQFAAGMWEFAANNIFGASAFSTFGAFWISLSVYIWAHEGKLYEMASELDMTIFFCIWGVFVTMFTLITTRISQVHFMVFGGVAALFFLLAMGEHSAAMKKCGGYVGIATGALAIYLGYAQLLNEVWKGNYLPIGLRKPVNNRTVNKSKDKFSDVEDLE
mmetsp:Transcript_86529/g.181202  ORF Transcript_86529/g.181202 Transcript_86529/m.181202 type:complete len:175 (-) Transcript_86529:486-1010(-)